MPLWFHLPTSIPKCIELLDFFVKKEGKTSEIKVSSFVKLIIFPFLCFTVKIIVHLYLIMHLNRKCVCSVLKWIFCTLLNHSVHLVFIYFHNVGQLFLLPLGVIFLRQYTGAGHIIRISWESWFISVIPVKKWNLYNIYIHFTQTDIFQVFVFSFWWL